MKKSFQEKFDRIQSWNPPDSYLKINTLDAHTAGEPLRIILGGFPELPGDSILAKRRFMKDNYDHLRTALMFEPRGHADMYGCIITEPVSPESDFGVIFMHNEGYSTMCGHGIIAVTKAAIETGMIEPSEPVTTIEIDSPAGLITSHAKVENGKVDHVYFRNVPSFIHTINEFVDVPGLGRIKFDIAYGGAFYAFVKAEDAGVKMTPDNFRELIEKGMMIKRAVMNNFPVVHPFEKDLSFLYGTIFYGKPESSEADSRNVCIFAEGEVDRSPTGTGVSARMALHFGKGEIEFNEELVIESILGTKFTGKVAALTEFGKYEAVIPEVSGNTHITGKNTFLIHPEDNLKHGFILR